MAHPSTPTSVSSQNKGVVVEDMAPADDVPVEGFNSGGEVLSMGSRLMSGIVLSRLEPYSLPQGPRIASDHGLDTGSLLDAAPL